MNKINFSGLRSDTNPLTIEDKIQTKARELDLDPKLMLRLAEVESGLDPKAISPVGARGIYQLMDITIVQIAKLGYQVDDPFDPDQNINAGLIYFKWLYSLYEGEDERTEKTLAAWNWGQSNFPKDKSLDYETMPAETRQFISKVLGK